MSLIPQKILIATRNKGKVKEIQDLVKDLPVAFLSLADIPETRDVVEDGETFEENALKKARELARITDLSRWQMTRGSAWTPWMAGGRVVCTVRGRDSVR